ncbi:MAG: methyltransferase [Rubrivivax sp.]
MNTLPPEQRFFAALDDSLAQQRFVKLVLAKPRGGEPGLERLTVRLISLRGAPALSFLYRHATRDLTRNHTLDEGLAALRSLVGTPFRNAHLLTSSDELQLSFTKKGDAALHSTALQREAEAAPQAHDRAKQRWLSLDRPFLAALGVTTPQQHQLVPAMSRKWKQINRFVEIFAHALDSSPLAGTRDLHVVDFGSGKGYLTFAIHDWLRGRGVQAEVTGVELRPDMVALCNDAIAQLGLEGLRIEQGDVRSWQPARLDVMIALHACDIATDHAIHLGLRAGAEIIVCSPCCHKELRPQLLSPHPIAPVLQYGVHQEQQAEMLTDSLRALLLEARGYDTQVFEFVSLEHTNKNKMILAVKRRQPRDPAPVLAQIEAIKAFYGIREQRLERLLQPGATTTA